LEKQILKRIINIVFTTAVPIISAAAVLILVFYTVSMYIFFSSLNQMSSKADFQENLTKAKRSHSQRKIELPGKEVQKYPMANQDKESIPGSEKNKALKISPSTAENLPHSTNRNKDPLIKPENMDLPILHTDALDHIIMEFQADADKEKAFTALIEIKDELKGEDLHSALKQMHQLSDVGGNDVLIDTFLNLFIPLDGQDRSRILSYINPEHELSKFQLQSLSNAYLAEEIPEASEVVLITISQAGGDEGAQILIDMIDSETNDAKYTGQVTALGYSDSPVAFDYLNQTLNELTRVDTEDRNTERIHLIQNLIIQKKRQ